MSDIILRCNQLTKVYGGLIAVDHVNLELEEGCICGLVGKNGAGKTTLIRMLTGLTKPTFGTYEVCPAVIRTDTTVAAIVERPSIYMGLSAMDNLIIQSKLLGITPDLEHLTRTLEIVGLSGNLPNKAGNFSLGMRQRLAVAMTLVGRPKVLLLDEPTNGLDPQGIFEMRELFVRLNKEFGTTLLISSHILSELGKFATEYVFMHNGRVIRHIKAAELAASTQKSVKVTVDDVEKAQEVLSQFGNVSVIGANIVELFADVATTELVMKLAEVGVNVTSIVTAGEDLEEYYLKLMGGDQR